MKLKISDIPKDWPVRPLRKGQRAIARATDNECGLSWDDGIVTSMTPAPSGRCPFEAFHKYGDVESNPPMYAHHLRERKTHGLNLKQMRRLYAMVSRGNQKAITFARNVLGIPFDETPSQVKAVVKHHVLDLAERKLKRVDWRKNDAYAEGWLKRRLRGNPVIFVRTEADVDNVRKQVAKGMVIEEVSNTRTGKRVLLSPPRPGERTVWGESFDAYAKRVFGNRRMRSNPAEDVTPVVFRTFRGDHSVIALFPFEPGSNDPWTMMSYQHIGQHGIASHGLTHSYTRASTPDEIRPLKKELEQIGYKLKIIARIPNNAWKIRDAKIRRIK